MEAALSRDGAQREVAKPPAGWYAHPTMSGTRRYWDGRRWTDHIAPAEPARPESKPIGVLTIARGVALGLLIALALLWAYDSFVTSNDGADCAIRNAERAMGERSGPVEECPD